MSRNIGPRSMASLRQSIADSPWMIYEHSLHTYIDLVTHDERIVNAMEDTQNFFGLLDSLSFEKSQKEQMRMVEGTAVLDVVGVLSPKWNWISALLQMTTLDVLESNFRSALEDSNVSRILIYIDSPGGKASGNDEMSRLIFESRGIKPIDAFSEGFMGSAAYYIGSAADQIKVTNSSTVGSIGSMLVHVEASEAAKQEGYTFTVLKYGDNKAVGNPYEKLSERNRALLQEYVNESGRQFVESVARNRGISFEQVREEYGDGMMFHGIRALEIGMVDELTTLAEMLKCGPKQITENTSMADENNVTKSEFDSFKDEMQKLLISQQESIGKITSTLETIGDTVQKSHEETEKTRRAATIAEKCQMAGVPEMAAQLIADENLSVEDVTQKLFAEVCKNRTGLTSDGGDGTNNTDDTAKYRAEYQEHKEIHEQLHVTLEEYIEQRLIEDGKKEEPVLSHTVGKEWS